MEAQACNSHPIVRPKKKRGKELIKHIRTLAGVTMLLTAIAASGQLSHQMRVTVPFSFTAGGVSSPAGEYRVEIDGSLDRVTLIPYKSKPRFLLTTQAWQRGNTQSFLRFRRYGQRWFLQEVAVQGVVRNVPMLKRDQQFIAAGTLPTDTKPIVADIAAH
jgi:hypothetical protein